MKVIDWFRRFLGPPISAISGYLSVPELVKAVVLGLVTGGGLLGILTQIQAQSGVVFPSPSDDALVAALLAFLIDAARRLPQGRKTYLPQ